MRTYPFFYIWFSLYEKKRKQHTESNKSKRINKHLDLIGDEMESSQNNNKRAIILYTIINPKSSLHFVKEAYYHGVNTSKELDNQLND